MKQNVEIKKTGIAFLQWLSFAAFTMIAMIPIYYLVITTLKTPEEALNEPLNLPEKFLFEGYRKAWMAMNYIQAFKNSFLITAFSLTGLLIFASMAAYTLCRRKNKWNTTIFYIFLSGMMVPFQMSILAQYKLVRSLSLMNNIFSVVLINIAVNMPMAILFIKNFIRTSVPVEIEEAARIDGCGVYKTFAFIALPLLKPVIATLAVMNSIAIWNDFLTPLMFLQTKDSRTMMLAVSTNIGQFSTNWTDLFPMLLLAVLPLVIFFLIMQKNIIAGISAGGVKG